MQSHDPYLPGEVVLAGVRNPLENPGCSGKFRPVALVDRVAGHWRVMGLTSKSTFASGKPRTPVPNPLRVGLNGPGYLWGDKLTNVSALDIGRHLGWVDLDLAMSVIREARLTPQDARGLLEAVLDWIDELGA